jgi:tetratricopeptide (TPR) repeat protein
VSETPETAAQLLQKSVQLRREGDEAGALDAIQRAHGLRPSSLKIAAEYARTLAEAGRVAEGEAALKASAAVLAPSAALHAAFASFYSRTDQAALAEQALVQAVLIEPDDLASVQALSRAQAKDGRRADAIETLAGFLSRNPDQTAAWAELAGLHREARAFTEAQACYQEILEREPQSSHAVIGLADILIAASRGAQAVERLEAFLEGAPNHAGVLLRYAQALQAQGRGLEAIAAFERAVAAPNASARAWIALASAHVRETSTFRAAEVLREGCTLNPDNPRLHLALAEQTLRIGLIDEARTIAQEALDRAPLDAGLGAFLTRVAIRAGRFDEAQQRIADFRVGDLASMSIGMRLQPLLDRAMWRINEAVAAHEEVAGLADAGPGDHDVEAVTRLIALDVVGGRSRLRLASEEKAARTGGHRRWSSAQGLAREILNDFWTDPGALAAAQDARRQGVTRLWRTTVRSNPHHTGCALGLLVQLRQTGAFNLQERLEEGAAIPRLIHQFWDSAEPPRDVEILVSTWRDQNPDFSHTLYDMRSASTYLGEHHGPDILRAFRRSPSVAGKADILRLALLLREGGVYADADDRCAGSLVSLLAGRDLVVRQEIFGSIGNNFIAVTPGHPLIRAALDQSVEAILRGDRESIWLISGPGMLTRAFALHVAESRERLDTLGKQIAVMDQHAMLAWCVSGCQATYKQSSRGWLNLEFGRR